MQNARFYTNEQLSPRQSMTPEGFLLCEAVPIARTGYQLYADGEIPGMTVDQDGILTIRRGEAEVFRPETIASFEGKPVTIEHPPEFVTPENWKDHAVGTTQNVRRGENIESDLLLADLLITDAEAIKLVRAEPGKPAMREVSCGYDSGYVQDAPGAGHQRDIIGNHVAIVPRGRAGPRCSIQDKEPTVAAKIPNKIAQVIRKAFATKDSDGLEKVLDAEMPGADDDEDDKKETKDAISALSKTVDTLAAAVNKLLTKDEEAAALINNVGTPAARVKEGEVMDADPDEAETAEVMDSMKNFASRAEILVPGYKVPTTDSIKRRTHVVDALRKVLAQAAPEAIAPFLSGRTLDALSAPEVVAAFNGAAALAASRNNAGGARLSIKTTDFGRKPTTVADINARNKEFWSKPRS